MRRTVLVSAIALAALPCVVEAQANALVPMQGFTVPWGREGRGRPQTVQLFDAMKGVALASKQVVMAGNPTQIEAATEIMKDARKKLYQLLAAD